MLALCESAPAMPVTVTLAEPDAATEAVKVRVVLPWPVTLAGLKAAVTPLGRPEAEKLTLPLNPLEPATVTLKLVPLPAVTVCEPGLAENEKSGFCCTLRVATHLLSALLHSVCQRNPSTVALGSPAQMSPISPLALSYQPSHLSRLVSMAMPTSGSVTVSAISCVSTTVRLSLT